MNASRAQTAERDIPFRAGKRVSRPVILGILLCWWMSDRQLGTEPHTEHACRGEVDGRHRFDQHAVSPVDVLMALSVETCGGEANIDGVLSNWRLEPLGRLLLFA